jgi:hypothetical protein
MTRMGGVLAVLAWAAGSIAWGQGTPTTPPPHELPAVESGVLPPPAPAAPAQPPATAEPPADPAKPAEPPADPAKIAATLAELAKGVETLGKNLTVVTGDEQIKLVLGGVITADFYYNHACPVAPGIPFFLTPRSPFGFSQDTFDANARQTTLFGLVSGPKIGNFESGGLIAVCLFNDALVVDRYGVLPIQAYAQLKNDDWRFAAGLQFDVFNPLNPTMLTFSFLGGSGNAGAGFPGQARVERYFHPADDTQITLTVALSEPLPTTVNNNLQISEDNGWPNVEARAALALGPLQGEGPPAKRPFEAGVSGLVGQLRTTDPAGGADASSPTCGASGPTSAGPSPPASGSRPRCSRVRPSGRTPPASCRTSTSSRSRASAPRAAGPRSTITSAPRSCTRTPATASTTRSTGTSRPVSPSVTRRISPT